MYLLINEYFKKSSPFFKNLIPIPCKPSGGLYTHKSCSVC